MRQERSDALVLFGATGDLARKKLFPALYRLERAGRLGVPVIGVALSGRDVEALRQRARESVEDAEPEVDADALSRLCERLQYVDGDYRKDATYEALRKRLDGSSRPLHYLAIPPSMFQTVVQGLSDSGCARGGRVVVEKPFGRDLRSARQLNHTLHEVFAERQIFRIDHFMGKEAVQNLLYFRFANSFVEPIWNRTWVECIRVTLAEPFGVEGRGRFYEDVGAVRDVVQNHLLQVVALLTMEPPVTPLCDDVRDEQCKALKAVRPLTGRSLVRGQYRGYREEKDVAPDSQVETYAAMNLHIDSWRWAGVPVFVRSGKRLAEAATEVVVQLRHPPHAVFGREEAGRANYFLFRLGPDVKVALGARAKAVGEDMAGEPVELAVARQTPEEMSAYERLIGDALEGDPTLFGRQDVVEAAWRIVDPILKLRKPVELYEPGSWGPASADAMIEAFGGWQWPQRPEASPHS
jgi:glucose-6-phosphate 1-dehydrogenase